MIGVNDYKEEKECSYKGEKYLVRDNGAILRKSKNGARIRKFDDFWTFGKVNERTGYLEIASVPVHRIVATGFLGDPPSSSYVVDHIDTNRMNNRPSNLRWVTRLENVLLNPISRKRIEYKTGVSVFEFLKNPSKFKDCFDEPDFSWMRQVTEEEAKSCLNNMLKWSKTDDNNGSSNGRIGNWVYYETESKDGFEGFISSIKTKEDNEKNMIPEGTSLTINAKQINWKTPTSFLCCPEVVEGNPIECYYKNLSKKSVFSNNQYGDSVVVKYASVDSKYIVVITTMPSSIKPLALVKITYEDGYYIHTSLGTFFSKEGADKYFTLEQGLEWTGKDSIDDYC